MLRTLPFLLLSLVALSGCGTPVGADPITLNISYYERSNHGDQDATGTVMVDPVTGDVVTTVSDLPALDGEVYEGWLAGGGESPTSTGRFNTDESGSGSISVTLGDISASTYAFFVLTVEPEPDSDPAPDPRHSIGADLP